jgi:phospholipase C
MPTPFKHLVVLMMENRSFDHMLGFLKSDDYPIEGLNGDESNPPATEGGLPVVVSRDAHSVHDLNPDPGHDFIDVNVQIFGNKDATPGGPPMQGFVQDYALVSNHAEQGANIMKCFTADTLPVLSTLARQFAVCDHWYSSVPGPTIPNRLFAHAASSAGSVTQDAVAAPAVVKTIFEVIDDPANQASFRIYTSGASILLANLYLARHQTGFHPYSEFRDDCLRGDLPEYTFIEPSYDDDIAHGLFATSQHPDFPVNAGEALISDVYNALRDGPQWETTLLLIVYDEHGGIFDHVPPPALVKDPANAALPDPQPSTNPPFAFDRAGVRVPAVFVSPYLAPGTIISQPFDHCSIVATVRKLFCLDKTPFNWREAQAATFENILNLAVEDVRTDHVVLPAPVVAAPPPDAIAAANAAFATATAHPKIPPAVRKPTDLALSMAKAMEYTMEQLHVKTKMAASQIYSAQDAADFLNDAATALTGAAKTMAGGGGR